MLSCDAGIQNDPKTDNASHYVPCKDGINNTGYVGEEEEEERGGNRGGGGGGGGGQGSEEDELNKINLSLSSDSASGGRCTIFCFISFY